MIVSLKGGEDMTNKKLTMKAIRINANLTQQELADAMGVSRSSVIAWETGKTKISTVCLMAFCYVTNVTISDISLPGEST